MKIPSESIEQYKEVFKKEYGFEISNEQAYHELHALLTLMDAVYRHINKENYSKLNEVA
ncbi:hypothetical protein K9M47_01980 [Candidatus Gracilibacteria bacterium]|nr:hypothetical protein [Candidatus Gracilibacteria bacterium]